MIRFPELKDPFPSDYERFIFTSRYARWVEDRKRRETWSETVQRLVAYYGNRTGWVGNEQDWLDIYKAIHNLETMPSMRSVMTSGEAMDKNDVCGYNCAYLPVDTPKSFESCSFRPNSTDIP